MGERAGEAGWLSTTAHEGRESSQKAGSKQGRQNGRIQPGRQVTRPLTSLGIPPLEGPSYLEPAAPDTGRRQRAAHPEQAPAPR